MSFLSGLRTKKKQPVTAEPIELTQSQFEKFTQAQKDALQLRIERDKQKNEHLRADQRQSCCLISRLEFAESGLAVDGVVTDASLGGINFRPASRFILERSNERIQIHIGDISLKGFLRRTHPNGYGIQMTPRMTHEQLADVLAGPTTDSF